MSLSDTRDLSLQVQVSFALSTATIQWPFNSLHVGTRLDRHAVL